MLRVLRCLYSLVLLVAAIRALSDLGLLVALAFGLVLALIGITKYLLALVLVVLVSVVDDVAVVVITACCASLVRCLIKALNRLTN